MSLPGVAALLLVAILAPQRFDVASIKPNVTGGEARRAGASRGGVFTASNVSLRLLISRAYGLGESQIEGGPNWITTDTWDISARANGPVEMTSEQLQLSLQVLLAERFQLRIHRQTKQGTVLSLVAIKGGPKLREHMGEGTPAISMSSTPDRISITGAKITMARLAEYLTGQARRPVVDNTGLVNEYDFIVEWAADDTNPQGPSLFAALEEQLGLKLEAAKGPIETIVVDGAERASAN